MIASEVVTPLLWGSLFSMAVAQFLKPFLDVALRRGFQWRRAFDSGGMPSSHTSLVTTLTLGVAAVEGTGSSIFAVTLAFSLYFVFEATGLRQEVGQQARILNEMFDELLAHQTVRPDDERLRELVGHTWAEVLGGGVVGTLIFLLLRGEILAG
ncbi:divergent PAP2 family protein [bacterium]|nr:MAG: divergent PAP2 family protein [bacterium]RKZ14916.1 MAG: divergent PAP2 family protein [bacterium]